MRKPTTSIRIRHKDLERLQRLSKQEEEPVSVLIRIAIREYLDREEKKSSENVPTK